jgi:hypothetical protein
MAGGTVYGSNAGANSNTAIQNPNSAALYVSSGATAEYGRFDAGGAWTKNGDLTTTSDTIKVVNGIKQP